VSAEEGRVGEVGEVGEVGVSGTEQDVVVFAPGCWSVAVGEHASAVPGSRRGALVCGVGPLSRPTFSGDLSRIEGDRLGVPGTGESFHGGDVHRVGSVVAPWRSRLVKVSEASCSVLRLPL
jgi:hypothetical protein